MRRRGALKPERLANTGRLYNYTIVHRSFPGVETPFISAIVDLERAWPAAVPSSGG
jgi:hypothetical protein